MFATIRNRRGIISAVEPFDGEKGRLHLVHLEYKDDQLPFEEQLLWEIEPNKTLLEPTALPDLSGADPMPVEDYDSLLRATRWTAISPYLDPDEEGPLQRQPISSPFHGAVQVEDYQLVPLLKALRMPRVNLLIADDVGIGKTIEAGLILSELLIRRRIQRVLILTPASLRLQWRDEMWEKFSLSFDLVNRAETHNLRKRLGLDANPWRSFSRIITSYHYLRQDDVIEQFLAACRTPEGSPHLPWDLLIVDECHNLMPSAFGDDSDLCRMLRLIAPQFEHRIFLSATPHNGHTRCFTGLLEMLDPVRFSQTNELKPAEKARIEEIVLRRLKREINARSNPPKFCTRLPPKALLLKMSPEEVALGEAFDAFRKAVKKLIGGADRRRRRSGSFAVEILGKRLLSCPTAFAESWKRSKEGLKEAAVASDSDMVAAERSVRQDTGDDQEAQKREETAAGVTGSWLKTMDSELKGEIADIDRAVSGLKLKTDGEDIVKQDPSKDSRFDAFCALIDQLLRKDGKWRDDERLVVFTEYKTTLDYIVRRLRGRYEEDRILTLFGSGGKDGMGEMERDLVKIAFNDPSHSVRILIATDAAAEGLNLQETARYLLHFDCPWNPSRLEQRNGRIDRHGQARDVTIHHFVSDQDQDLRFLAHVLKKADEIREDLGSVNELFDEAAHRRLIEGEDLESVQRDLERQVKAARGRASFKADDTIILTAEGKEQNDELKAIAAEIDLDSLSLRETLESAMAIRAGRPQFSGADEPNTWKILNSGLPGWCDVIDESLRRKTRDTDHGPVMRLAFGPEPFIKDVGGRKVFSPRKDVTLMHLSHPMMQKALSSLTRHRFPGTGNAVSRWTVRTGGVPKGVDALLLMSVEELAVNDLRESFHHWVRTIIFPIRDGKVGDPLPHRPSLDLRMNMNAAKPQSAERAAEIFEQIEQEIKNFIKKHEKKLTEDLRKQLELDGGQARKREDDRYRSRQGEVSSLIAENTIRKFEDEIKNLKQERQQGLLFDESDRLDQIDRSIEEKQEEISRRTRHYDEVRKQLEKERVRILKHVLPARHAMSGDAKVFPICIEIRLPGVES